MRNFKPEPSGNNKYFDDLDPLEPNIKKHAIRGAGASFFSHIYIFLVQIIGIMILARLLTPADFGLVAMVLAFSMLLQNFGVNGFTEATIQRKGIEHKQISTFFWINISLNLALALLFIACAPLFAWFYKEPQIKLIVVVMSLSIFFAGASSQHIALLMRKMQFYKYAAINMLAVTLSLIIAIILALLDFGYWALVARWVASPLITAVCAWTFCRWRPSLPVWDVKIKPMVKFAMNIYGVFSVDYFSRNLDKMLIGRYLGAQLLGYYQRAYYLLSLPTNQITAPLTNVVIATLSRLTDNLQKFLRYYSNALSIVAFIGMFLSAGFTLMGKDIILLLLGPQWNIAGKIMSIFGPGVGIMLIYTTNVWLHYSLGNADRCFRWSFFKVIVTTLCILIGLRHGIFGVAVGYIVSFYILLFPGLLYAGKPIGLKLRYFISNIWKYFVAALITYVLCWFVLYSFSATSYAFIRLNVFFRIAISGALCLLTYLFCVIVLCRGLKPIKELFSLLPEMLPGKIKIYNGSNGN